MNENNSNSTKSKNGNSSKNKNKTKPFYFKKKKTQNKKTIENKVNEAKSSVSDLKLYEKIEAEPKKKQEKNTTAQNIKKTAQTKKSNETNHVAQNKQNTVCLSCRCPCVCRCMRFLESIYFCYNRFTVCVEIYFSVSTA